MTRKTLLFLLFLLASCNPDRIRQTDELKQEMADKKIKRVTNAELNETVNAWGEQMIGVMQNELTAKLQAGGSADSLCQLRQLPKTTALAKRYDVGVNLLGPQDVKNPRLAAKEREILDAYLYNAENKLPQQSNIQRIGDSLFVYNVVVPTENIICKTCFGNQSQPLGVWRLVFRKREVVRRMSVKKK
jgi:hypothetical protein